MARPAGVTAAVLPGDLEFSAGGMNADFLIGAFVKDVTASGLVTLQNASGDERQVQIAGVQGATGAVDIVTTPINLPFLANGPAGTIASLDLTSGGMDYAANPTVTFSGGGGMNAAARAFVFGGEVDEIQVTNTGSGYTSPPTVSINAPVGSGAMATITDVTGIGNIQITNGGSGYSAIPSPQIQFTGGGETTVARAAGNVDPNTGAITSLVIGSYGSGYTGPSTGTVVSGGGSGSGFAATAGTGGVSAVNLTAGGSNYYVLPTITLTGGGGSGAVLVPTIRNRRVTRVRISDPGGGYTTAPTVTFTSGNQGSGATATATVAPIDWVQFLTADQWMDKGQLYILLSIERSTGIAIYNWIVPTYFIANQISAQSTPVQLYRATQNLVGTAAYTDSNGISNSFFFRPNFGAPTYYIAKDTNNNLWASVGTTLTGDTHRILRIGGA